VSNNWKEKVQYASFPELLGGFIWQNFLEGVFLFESVLIWHKVKVVSSVLCFELFVNAFTFLVESKKLGQKVLPNKPTHFSNVIGIALVQILYPNQR
jgi:hypothetical protein